LELLVHGMLQARKLREHNSLLTSMVLCTCNTFRIRKAINVLRECNNQLLGKTSYLIQDALKYGMIMLVLMSR
jgi:hypothetical protein